VDSTTGSAESNSADDSTIFCNVDDDEHWHCPPDAGTPGFECDLWVQDCPKGEKCLPWAQDGSPEWNATRCTPIAPMPTAVGDACTVEVSAVSGIDSCDLGLMCWHVDPATLEGECVAICAGDQAAPLCEDPNTTCSLFNYEAIVLCLPACDPIVPLCDVGEVCVPTPDEDHWVCAPNASVLAGIGEGCEYLNACEPGSVCAAAEVVPGCEDSPGCCTPRCDLDMPVCPDEATECAPWYARGNAPPSYENAGICSTEASVPDAGWISRFINSLVADTGR